MDTVFIRDLRLVGKHGVGEHEHRVEQEFIFDITASFDARKSAESDDINDTIDYARFRDIAKEIVEGPHHYLIEKIATIVAREILKDARIHEVTVAIRKPAVIPNATPGISITRTRTDIH
jgi:dihydroneopterin aldolase